MTEEDREIARLALNTHEELLVEAALLRVALRDIVNYPPVERGPRNPAKAYVRWDAIEYAREVLRQTGGKK